MYARVHFSPCLLCSCMCARVYNMYVCTYRVLVYMYMPVHKQLACYAHVLPVINLFVIYVRAVPMYYDFFMYHYVLICIGNIVLHT